MAERGAGAFIAPGAELDAGVSLAPGAVIPRHRHDTDDHFYPIQAADLFAGYYREQLVAESEESDF